MNVSVPKNISQQFYRIFALDNISLEYHFLELVRIVKSAINTRTHYTHCQHANTPTTHSQYKIPTILLVNH